MAKVYAVQQKDKGYTNMDIMEQLRSSQCTNFKISLDCSLGIFYYEKGLFIVDGCNSFDRLILKSNNKGLIKNDSL